VKLGAENRTKLIVAIGLMVVAGLVLVYNFSDSSPSAATPAFVPPGTPSQTATPARPAPRTKGRGKKASAAARSLDPVSLEVAQVNLKEIFLECVRRN